MSHVSRSTFLIAIFFGIDKVFGLARQVLIAREFGLSYELDAFNAANNIPDLLSALISGGALGVALIPVLSEYLEKKGVADAWDLFARILNIAFLVTGAFSLLIALFAEPLIGRVIAPGFPAEQKALAVSLMRLDLFAIMIFSISGLVMAGLQANQHFLFPAMAPVLYNVGQIVGVLIFARETPFTLGPVTFPALGMGIHGLVYGVIFGAALHLLIQFPGLVKHRFRWSPAIGLRTAGVQQVLRLLMPRVATMFFVQWFFIVRDNLASGLGEGAVTALNYGWFIMQVPETLIGSALAIALLPTIAEQVARKDMTAYRETINRVIRVLFTITLPVCAIMFVGVEPLVGVLGFDEEGISLVVLATRVYLFGLTGHALLEIAVRSFYARQDAITPLWAAFVNALIYTGLALALQAGLGFAGIALANTIAFTLEALLLFWVLNRRSPGIFQVRPGFFRVISASVLGAGAAYLVLSLLPLDTWGGVLNAVAGMGAMAAGAAAALPFIWQEVKEVARI